MKRKNNFLGDIFQAISDVIAGAERSFLDLLSAFVPYFVPVIPAFLTFTHTKNEMGFPDWVAWTAAFVVEVLGMASVSTAIRFWRNNQVYKSDKEKAPFWVAVGVYVFYIVIVLSVNVLLEIVSGVRSGAVIWAIGLFSLLSFPSGVLISIRSLYTEMLEDRDERKAERHGLRPAYGKDTKQEKLKDEEKSKDKSFRE